MTPELRQLLQFAIEYFEQERQIIFAPSEVNGVIDDPDVAWEINRIDDWLRKGKAVVSFDDRVVQLKKQVAVAKFGEFGVDAFQRLYVTVTRLVGDEKVEITNQMQTGDALVFTHNVSVPESHVAVFCSIGFEEVKA